MSASKMKLKFGEKRKHLLIELAILFASLGQLKAGSVNLNWTANTEPDLAGYKAYWGLTPDNFVGNAQVGITTNYTVTGLTEGNTWYFALSAFDTSGNESGLSNVVSLFLPAPPPTATYSLWSDSQNVTDFSTQAASVEVGVKFQSDQPGVVTGIRFFKSTSNTGTHIGNLWSSTGVNLGGIVFSGETASGWQQALFPSPIPITANTIYVASYHTNVGFYGMTSGYFASAGLDSGPLHAPAGTNGVFVYPQGFPTDSYYSSNYWVDVLFQAGSTSPPVPTVTLIANPTSIQTGSSSNLSWSSTNANSVSIDQGIGSVAVTGNQNVSPIATTTYTATATGAGGTATASAAVTVTQPPPPLNILNVTKTVSRCSFVLSALPPNTTGGWSAQFYRGGTTAIGSPDSSAPFTRTVELTAGSYLFSVVFSKSGQANITYPTVNSACP